MDSFNEHTFISNVNSALDRVRKILDNNKSRYVQVAESVPHKWVDKYMLAESLTNTTIQSLANCLEAVGLTPKVLPQLKDWAKTRNVTLRLKAEENTKFLRKTTRDVESDTKHVSKGVLGLKTTSYDVTTITEYFWSFEASWELFAYAGTDVDNKVTLLSHTGAHELKTSADVTPQPVNVVRNPLDLNITWLLQNISLEKAGVVTPSFSINRGDKKCATPRRNPDIENALKFERKLHKWASSVHSYIYGTLFSIAVGHNQDLSAINDYAIFVPVLPLFNSKTKHSQLLLEGSSSSSGSIVQSFYATSFSAEEQRNIDGKFAELTKIYPTDKIVTLTAAKLLVILLHAKRVAEYHSGGVDYIENMLYKQIQTALGKRITPDDFTDYLVFHNRKLFKPQYQPRVFSHAIRRPDHDPEGSLSLMQVRGNDIPVPLSTLMSYASAGNNHMFFPINASTKVGFTGDRYLHGWVSHKFSDGASPKLQLVARARQFSCFIVLVGRIAGANLFEPTYGIIVQNKDEISIPLDLDTIPTPKEFRDAIESLSPEQQAFCKAFRSMQLESTLFGVCVIQVKPQLEKLLNLPDDSLTKEIQLTQDLMKLFLEYQTPSDLLSYDGDVNAKVGEKVSRVKELAGAMNGMIAEARREELEAARQEREYRKAQEEAARRAEEEERRRIAAEQDARRRREEKEKESFREAESMAGLYSRQLSTPGGVINMARPRMAAPTTSSAASVMMFDSFASSPAPKSVSAAAPPPPPPTASSTPAPPPPAPSPAPTPTPTPEAPQPAQTNNNNNNNNNNQQQQNQNQQQEQKELARHVADEDDDVAAVDYTKIPPEIEKKFGELDESNALRPTIINPGKLWMKKYYRSLLSAQESTAINSDKQKDERNKAFDLLDALTKSGALSVDQASLHVIIAATHCFDKTLIDTIVQDNINPIEKVENSSLIVASTIHRVTPQNLIKDEHVERVKFTSPLLITDK